MGVFELTDRDAVLAAIAEFDELGREAFLAKHHFKRARGYLLVHDGKEYDSKAVAGVGFGYQFPDRGALSSTEFSGGEASAAKVLRAMGFEVRAPEQSTRLPDWVPDEIILALDLYLRSGLLDDADPLVVELSEVLRSLPIHAQRTQQRFRNPNGVTLKLANLAALDPSHPGRGMTSVSKADRDVWDRFHDQPEQLASLAMAIRAGAQASTLPDIPEEDEDEAVEGRLVFRMHRARERDRAIVRRKKQATKDRHQRLACEVCGLDFAERYGALGEDFIECHHRSPLSETGTTSTRLADLALVCSNCHRMIHRHRPWITVEDLRSLVEERAPHQPSAGLPTA